MGMRSATKQRGRRERYLEQEYLNVNRRFKKEVRGALYRWTRELKDELGRSHL
jgi:hypothetical protein